MMLRQPSFLGSTVLLRNVGGCNAWCVCAKPDVSISWASVQHFDAIALFAFSLQRCCKNRFSHSHAPCRAYFFVLGMQRGNANIDFCNTSQLILTFLQVPSDTHRAPEGTIPGLAVRLTCAHGALRISSVRRETGHRRLHGAGGWANLASRVALLWAGRPL